MLNLTWMRPFKVGNHAAKFQGFVNYVGEKGEDYNDKDTAAETLVRTALMVAALPGDSASRTCGSASATSIGTTSSASTVAPAAAPRRRR